MQRVASFGQHCVWEFDIEPVPAVADATLQEFRPMVARDRCDQGGFAIDQFEADPFPGRLRIPNPAVDSCPAYCVDMALQSAIGLDRSCMAADGVVVAISRSRVLGDAFGGLPEVAGAVDRHRPQYERR
jgi:hypothetical protein